MTTGDRAIRGRGLAPHPCRIYTLTAMQSTAVPSCRPLPHTAPTRPLHASPRLCTPRLGPAPARASTGHTRAHRLTPTAGAPRPPPRLPPRTQSSPRSTARSRRSHAVQDHNTARDCRAHPCGTPHAAHHQRRNTHSAPRQSLPPQHRLPTRIQPRSTPFNHPGTRVPDEPEHTEQATSNATSH